MSQPIGPDLLDLATPYALHAMSESERTDVDHRLAAAPPEVADAFADEVRAVRETMAALAAGTAAEPPADLRDRVLDAASVRELRRPTSRRWRPALVAAAAVVVVAAGALGVGLALRPTPTPTTAEQVFAAPDVQTVSGPIPAGGKATVVFSRERNAGVLVMNDVPPPQAGTVYQMWLVGANGARPAGTMDARSVAPSTTAVLPDLGASQALAFTVEPSGGSAQPTSPVFAELPLV
jgi:anti-sigma-K factor RskA